MFSLTLNILFSSSSIILPFTRKIKKALFDKESIYKEPLF